MQRFRIRHWRNWLIHPLVMAIPFAVFTILTLPDYFPKYEVVLLDQGMIDKPGYLEYQKDIDGDHRPERIAFFSNTEKKASIKILEEDHTIGKHYYTDGTLLSLSPNLYFFDRDSSGAEEIYFFTRRHDSLFFQGVDHAGKQDFIFRDVFITRLADPLSEDYRCEHLACTDLDGDKTNEFLINYIAGFPLQPRGLAVYDPDRDTVYHSPFMGVYISGFSLQDVDGDGTQEIFPRTYSISNHPDTLGSILDDHSAWIMAFDHRLQFLFEPRPFKGQYRWVNTVPILSGNRWKLLSMINQNTLRIFPSRFILSTLDGVEEKSISTDSSLIFNVPELNPIPGNPSVLTTLDINGSLYGIDSSLSITPFRAESPLPGYFTKSEDFNHDGNPELLINNRNHTKVYIASHDFSDLTEIPLSDAISRMEISVAFLDPSNKGLFVQKEDNFYLFKYQNNPYFYLRIPFYLGIYLILAFILWMILYVQKRVWLRQQATKKQIAALQLLLLKNQLGPHFTFNVISSITALINLKRHQEADKMAMQLARLLRANIDPETKITRTLKEELDFVKDYVAIEQIRANHTFEQSFKLSPDIDLSMPVPRMIIQLYVENAIKHGLRGRGEGGRLEVRVSRIAHLFIVVEDNGIGREAAKQQGSQGTGQGMKVMEQFLELVNQMNKQEIMVEVIDLKDASGEANGTRVEITVPGGMEYEV